MAAYTPGSTGTRGSSGEAAKALLSRHPLQRLHSPSRGASAVVHFIGICTFLISFKHLEDNPNIYYGRHWQHLTVIGLTLALLCFIFGFLADITLSRRCFFIKNALSVASAPMEVLISMLYWGLSVIDPKLVVPEDVPGLPLSIDLSMHLAPAILLTVDLLLLSPPWTISALPALALSCVIASGYWVWVEQCYAQNGFYPYPIFYIESHLRAGLFAGSAVTMALSTFCLKWLYGAVNGQSTRGNVKAMGARPSNRVK